MAVHRPLRWPACRKANRRSGSSGPSPGPSRPPPVALGLDAACGKRSRTPAGAGNSIHHRFRRPPEGPLPQTAPLARDAASGRVLVGQLPDSSRIDVEQRRAQRDQLPAPQAMLDGRNRAVAVAANDIGADCLSTPGAVFFPSRKHRAAAGLRGPLSTNTGRKARPLRRR